MKKAVCQKCQNYQAASAETATREACCAPRNMFVRRVQEGLVCLPLRAPAELNRNHNCAWFQKVPIMDQVCKALGVKKPDFGAALGGLMMKIAHPLRALEPKKAR